MAASRRRAPIKLIVSPEFGERLDLQDHTRKLIERMEKDLGSRLELVAATTEPVKFKRIPRQDEISLRCYTLAAFFDPRLD